MAECATDVSAVRGELKSPTDEEVKPPTEDEVNPYPDPRPADSWYDEGGRVDGGRGSEWPDWDVPAGTVASSSSPVVGHWY